jgi:DNA polymerase III epsilon subunit-like protein
MAPVRVIALDTETTGLDWRASVWEIAVCPCLSSGPGEDVETLAVGYLRALEQTAVMTDSERDALRRILTPPYDSMALSRAVGVEPPGQGVRHTAGGDARWAAEMWDAVHRGDPRVLSQHWQHRIWEAAAETLET